MSSILCSFLILIMLGAACSYSADMGTCRMTCESPTGVSSWPIRGPSSPPGKRGPAGSKGQKGSKGATGQKSDTAGPCVCPDHENLQSQIDVLKKRLEDAYAPNDCSDVLVRRQRYKGGVYDIYPSNSEKMKVYCDTTTDSGGWLVFQRRMDGSEDFFRNWTDYVDGFGDLKREFWLGLDKIHKLMAEGDYELRVDMADFENNTAFAKYSKFRVEGPESFYALTASGYKGNAGNHLQLSKISFSTKDQDHDTSPANCAELYKGGMWYTSCHGANPNGLYLKGKHETYANGVNWQRFKGYNYSLKFIEMKMRVKT